MGIGPRASLSMDYKPLPLPCLILLPNSILMSLIFCHVLRGGIVRIKNISDDCRYLGFENRKFALSIDLILEVAAIVEE
ncbi:MAG: hypothetical protein LBT83_08705, partial [Tannerella sp.]|jgi:hypothetical protein|nr:hypothetical protein [Tannerella sp.]